MKRNRILLVLGIAPLVLLCLAVWTDITTDYTASDAVIYGLVFQSTVLINAQLVIDAFGDALSDAVTSHLQILQRNQEDSDDE